MYKPSRGNFIKDLERAKTEEDVKFAYAKAYKIKFDSAHKHDLYTPQILFEFKYDKNFENLKTKAEVLAQALYYMHRLKYGIITKAIPPIICLADINEASFTESTLWKEYYTDEKKKYDWDRAPSNPDTVLVSDLYADYELRKVHVYKLQQEHEYTDFTARITGYLSPQLKLEYADKKLITEENFEDVYNYWEECFGEAVRNGQKPSKYFVADIQEGKTVNIPNESKVLFRIAEGEYREKRIFAKDYDYFWSLYEKVSNPFIIRGIISKVDRLSDEALRRFHGEFFTPLPFAKKGLEYIEKTIGNEWWKLGYKMWDMAAGTGNLQYHLPAEAWEHLYLSSLHKEDVEHLSKLFPDAITFQYDYLNDDVEYLFANTELPFDIQWKLPAVLRQDLKDPKIKWIILINPPFATSQEAGTNHGRSKKDASASKVRSIMHNENLGEVSRELFSQFIFRINKELLNKEAHLCMYSKLKYLNSNNDQLLRDNIFHYQFEKGFMFSVEHFHGTKGKFPVGFLIWNLNVSTKLEDQNIQIDVFQKSDLKTESKVIINENRKIFLNKWIKRPPGVKIFPPFKSAITVAVNTNQDVRDKVAENFIGSLMCGGNDVQHQNLTSILSGPYVSAGALSITPDNFEKSMVVHAVRRLPKATWVNDRDQFMQPNTELSSEFIANCTIWNLFSSSNQTVSMKDVSYNNMTYQIRNQFFPFLKKDLAQWKIADSEIALTFTNDEDRFVAKWLTLQNLSDKALAVLNKAKEIYQYYFEHTNQLRLGKFKIQTWDAGWWQIRNALSDEYKGEELLNELKVFHSNLKEILVKDVYEYKFLG